MATKLKHLREHLRIAKKLQSTELEHQAHSKQPQAVFDEQESFTRLIDTIQQEILIEKAKKWCCEVANRL